MNDPKPTPEGSEHWADFAEIAAADLHERNTTGIDRRHWTETTVPGAEDQR